MATQKIRARETVRGNERIQQLMEEFPELPRVLVVKADVLREGVKPNAASKMAGRWALPDSRWYFTYDREESHTPDEITEGYTLSPISCYFPGEVNCGIERNSRSPYEFRYEEGGRYRLYRDGEPIEEVFFPHRPRWNELKTSNGKPMPSVIAQKGEHFLFIAALTYCEYGRDNLQCKYCNVNSSEAVKKDLGIERLVGKRDQDIYETYVAAAQEVKQRAFGLSGGVLLDSSKEAANYARIARVLKRAMKDVGYEVPINVTCQALEAVDQMRLKEAGVSSVLFDLEVWDPRLFEIICPGKAKHVGRERWIERLLMAKETWGKASTLFVLGVEMAPPYGFKTEDEAAESNLEGVEWMMERGVSAGLIWWRPAPGTEFEGMAPPRTEYFLRMVLAHHKLALKHNLAPRPFRGRNSGPTSRSISEDLPYVDQLRQASAAGLSQAGL